MMRVWCGLVCLLCVCLLAGGCTDTKKEPPTTTVSGKVLLDDKPMPDGAITFDGDPGTIPDRLEVKNGAFSGKVKLGKKKVLIHAYEMKPAPKSATGSAAGKEVQTNILPARFNDKTTLTADVTESGVNPSEFKVESK